MTEFSSFEARVNGDAFVDRVLMKRGHLSLYAQRCAAEVEGIRETRDVVLQLLREYHEWMRS